MEIFCQPPILVKAQNGDTQNKLRLTNIDQVFKHYRAIILGYNSNGKELEVGTAADPVAAMRNGLEEMVAHYPWVAGGIGVAAQGEAHRLEIGFNEGGGPGAQFVSARANCTLAHLGDLAEPNPAFAPLFATVDNMNARLQSRPLLALQVTTFEDGGVCVSMNWHHALFDGAAATIFLRNVCSCARGDGVCIQMDMAPRELRIKPSVNCMQVQQEGPWLHELYTKDWTAEHQSQAQPLAAMRFSFSREDLARLHAEALSKQQDCSGTGFKVCTAFQALAAHLWKAKAKSLIGSSKLEPSEAFPIHIAVNVRGHVVGSCSIPANYMGNGVGMAMASAAVEELTAKSLAFAVQRIQEAIGQVTTERFQSQVDYVQMLGGSAIRVLPPCVAIASLAGLGLCEADFGWGKPAYLGHPHEQRRYFVVVSEGQNTSSLNVFAVCDSQVQLQSFQKALMNLY